MKINQYNIVISNILTPVVSEYLIKLIKEQLQYLEKKGLIENSKIMVEVHNIDKKSVYMDLNMIKETR